MLSNNENIVKQLFKTPIKNKSNIKSGINSSSIKKLRTPSFINNIEIMKSSKTSISFNSIKSTQIDNIEKELFLYKEIIQKIVEKENKLKTTITELNEFLNDYENELNQVFN